MGWLLKWSEGREEMKFWALRVTIMYLVLLAFIFRNLDESHNEMASRSSWTLLRQWDSYKFIIYVGEGIKGVAGFW